MTDILNRRQTHFVLWCPTPPTSPPKLIIGRLRVGNPPKFEELARKPLSPDVDHPTLWQLAASTCGLTEGERYHYWFEVDNTYSSGPKRIQTTDPLAHSVDYRLYAPDNPSVAHPAAVIGWSENKLVACDPNGEKGEPEVTAFADLASNRKMVIYELPTAWARSVGYHEYERAVGTFRDAQALVADGVEGENFPELSVTRGDRQYLKELGVNALELLPPMDSIYAREWGYGTSHYLAPDYELGYPEGFLSPTSNQDLTNLINSCHQNGIRVLLDVVMGFMKDEPYRYIDFKSFYLENPTEHPDDEDAYTSRVHDGKRVFRYPFGGICPRYVKTMPTYDPISGETKEMSPARQHMLTFLARWMRDFQIDGIRMDSVENVANWDFIRDFKNAAHAHFMARYPDEGAGAADKFLVVGEELELPVGLLSTGRLDGLWNDPFQAFIRAAILGENAKKQGEPSFEWTVRRAINCREDKSKLNGSQAVNYLTSHDVQGERKERLYNLMKHVITPENSGWLYNRSEIENQVRAELRGANGSPVDEEEVQQRTTEIILHKARLRRIKLAFVCLLTAVGIPMILAGEEFGDEHDLFDPSGNVTHHGGKQVDPVNYSRVDEADRNDLFQYVAKLVKLRTAHPAFEVDETNFIHSDFDDGKRIMAWKRGTTDPIVVVANFSDFSSPYPSDPPAEYHVKNWPETPAGQQWFEVTRGERLITGRHDREPIFAWEAKVYRLVPVENG